MAEQVVFLRNSERKAYLTCRQMWWWSYVDLLQTKAVRPALDFGGLVHAALAPYYKVGRTRGPKPHITFQKLLAKFEEKHGEFMMPGDDGLTAWDLGTDMLKHYIEHWGSDDHIEVIAPEMNFQVGAQRADGSPLMITGADGIARRLVHVGTGDLVYRNLQSGHIGVMETKTAAAIETGHLGKDDQASSYWSLVPLFLQHKRILKPGQDINFIEYNFLRKAKIDRRPQDAEGHYLNKDGTVSKSQPAPYFARPLVWRGNRDRLSFLNRINRIAGEMSLVRRGKLPLYKNPSSAYPDKHCQGCEFRDMCDLHEIGSDWQGYAKETMGLWDPYADHRKEEK